MPDSGVSIRFTSLRFAAAPDLADSPARWPLSLRYVSQLEAAGDRQADSDARRLARFAYRVEANKRDRDRAIQHRSDWRMA